MSLINKLKIYTKKIRLRVFDKNVILGRDETFYKSTAIQFTARNFDVAELDGIEIKLDRLSDSKFIMRPH